MTIRAPSELFLGKMEGDTDLLSMGASFRLVFFFRGCRGTDEGTDRSLSGCAVTAVEEDEDDFEEDKTVNGIVRDCAVAIAFTVAEEGINSFAFTDRIECFVVEVDVLVDDDAEAVTGKRQG